MQGHLGERLIPDLVRELSANGSSGLLRVSRGKVIKAIFFEKGAPVFAISNLGSDQLERKLVEQDLATDQQLQQARQRADKPHRLASTIVEMGVVSDRVIRKVVREQVMEIILSLFDWITGEYTFEEKIRASHEVTLDIRVADILLEGARRAALNEQVAAALAPLDGVVVRAKTNGTRADSSKLVPIESYILSRIESPTAISEVGALSGIADEEAHRALCALVAVGFLKLASEDKLRDNQQARETDEQLLRLKEDIARRLHFFSSADYYEILGVGRQATTSDIKAAYYQLAKKFHPDRYRQSDEGELRGKLESLFAVISVAYDTLIDPAKRLSYDERIRKSPASANAAMHRTTPLPQNEPAKPLTADRAASRQSGALSNPPRDSDSPAAEELDPEIRSAGAAAGAGEHAFHSSSDLPLADSVTPKASAPTLSAEQLYAQGRARFDRREYHAAVHLLREAIRLDPNRAPYHFHLGTALIRNPRTRREAEEHLAKAAQLDTYSPQMRVKLGMLYKELGLHKKAEAYFRDALKMDPENKVAKRELGAAANRKDAGGSIWKSDFGSIAKKLFKK